MSDPSLPAGGPGRDSDGNFFLSDFEVQAAPAGNPASSQKIVFKKAAWRTNRNPATISTTW